LRIHSSPGLVIARLGDARRGDPDRGGIFDFRFWIFDWGADGALRGLPDAEAGDGFAVVFGVLEFAVERGDAGAGEGGVELCESADDENELGGRLNGEGRFISSRRVRDDTLYLGVLLKRPTFWQAAEVLDFGGEFAAEAVEFTDRQDDVAFEMRLDSAELKRRATETTELVGKFLLTERLVLRKLERNSGV
jgi:hypothetical protein